MSPVLDLTSETNTAVEFYYHMYSGAANGVGDYVGDGDGMGELLAQGTTDGGLTWENLFVRQGDQGNAWHRWSISFAGDCARYCARPF